MGMENNPANLDAFVQALPKTETHLHVEGALPYDSLLRPLDPVAYKADPQFRRKSYRYPSFPDFEKTLLDHALPWFTSAERSRSRAPGSPPDGCVRCGLSRLQLRRPSPRLALLC